MDKNMYFRKASVGNMTAALVATYLEVGPMTHPMGIEINVPAIGETGDTITPTVTFTDTTGVEGGSMVLPAITAKGRLFIPFFTNKKYVGLALAVLDMDTGADMNFGAVEAKIVPVGYDAQK